MKFLGVAFLGIISGLGFQTVVPILIVGAVLAVMFSITFTSSRSKWILEWSVFGFFQFVVGLYWLDIVGLDIVIAVSLYCVSWFLLSTFVSFWVTSQVHRTWLFVITLTLFENLRDSIPFGGFGWLQYGMIFVDTPLSIFHKVLPQLLMTLFALSMAAAIGLIFINALPRMMFAPIVLAFVALSVLSFVNFVEIDTKEIHKIVAVQGGVDRYGLGVLGDRTEVLKNHIEVTLQDLENINRADLVVWPENSLDIDPTFDQTAAKLLSEIDSMVIPPLLMGAVLSPSQSARSNTTMEIDGGFREIYAKKRLVPFGEFLPFRDLANNLTERSSLLPYDFIPGRTAGIWRQDDLQVSINICFEVADGFLIHEQIDTSDLILIQTNNATYQFSQQSEQQLLYARIRSIETSRPLISISTSGISALIVNGQIQDDIAKGERETISFEIFDYSGRTLTSTYAMYAGWIVFILWIGTFSFCLRKQYT